MLRDVDAHCYQILLLHQPNVLVSTLKSLWL
ncbi:hypothetical protein EPIR_2359 [Erwinia piriflorinigrans CFBP 5888]|uniref:Uncharacterized protein n=1 Tax=Erwinia piriflorinigrans CFBP 5888 TaxID=1161919 RepID=V5Z906_9GAMM|nr:hypothetical protein EPIR_2359 [Erwinia piriflorinigrans CFBP 5888]